MPNLQFPLENPSLQSGGLLRGIVEEQAEPVATPPGAETGGALRERIEEPLERELPPGVEQTFLESPILAQLDSFLRSQEFSPDQAAQLINSIIEAPAKASIAGRRPVARGPIGGPAPAGRTGTNQAQLMSRLGFNRGPSRFGRPVTGGPIGGLPGGFIGAPAKGGTAYAGEGRGPIGGLQSQQPLNRILNILGGLARSLGFSR